MNDEAPVAAGAFAEPGPQETSAPGPAAFAARGTLPTVASALAVFLAALLLYIATLAPTVGYGEAARLQMAARELEVTSAADSRPLFVAFAHGFALWLPAGDVAYRVNLASAVAAALAVVVVFLLCLLLLDTVGVGGSPRGRFLFAAAGAASLAVGQPFWARAVIADPTPFSVLLLAIVTALWIARLGGARAWSIISGTVLLGLLFADLRGVALVTPAYLITAIGLLARPGKRSATRAAGIVLLAYAAALVPLLLLAALDVDDRLRGRFPGEGLGLTDAVAGVATDLIGGPLGVQPAGPALTLFGLRLGTMFLAGGVLAVVGLLVLLLGRGGRLAGLFLLALVAAAAASSLVTASTEIVAWVALTGCVAVGAAVLGRHASGRSAAILVLILLVIPATFNALLPRLAQRAGWHRQLAALISIPAPGPARSLQPWRAGDRQARTDAEEVLAALPAGAVLVAGPDLAEPIRYLERIEKRVIPGTVVAPAPAALDTLLERHLGKRVVAIPARDSSVVAAVRERTMLVPRGPLWVAEGPAELGLAGQRFAERRFLEAAHHYGRALASPDTTGGGGGGTTRPASQENLARWAVALERSGFAELSADVTKRVLTAGPDSLAAHRLLGEIYFEAGANERAGEHFIAALVGGLAVQAPTPAAAADRVYLEGRIAEARGDSIAARATYQRCLDLDPDHRAARESLSRLDAR